MKTLYFSPMFIITLVSSATNAAYLNITFKAIALGQNAAYKEKTNNTVTFNHTILNISLPFNATGLLQSPTDKDNTATLYHAASSNINYTTTLPQPNTSTSHANLSTMSSVPFASFAARKPSMTSCSGPGVILKNKSAKEQAYAFYNNYWNGDGTAGANFDHPDPKITLPPGAQQYVRLDLMFKGRVQRGTELPATWVEFQIQATDGLAWGDISLQQGYDGPATIASPDGTGVVGGFIHDAFDGAPAAAFNNKPDGTRALASTMGNWAAPPNQAAIDHLNQVVGQKSAYMTGGAGTDMTISKTPCFVVTFY